MHRHQVTIAIAFAFLLGLGHGIDDLAGQQRSISPPLDPQAIAVARINLAKIDVNAIEKTLREHLEELPLQEFTQGIIDRNVRHFASRVRRLQELGVERINLVLTLYDLQVHYERLAKEPDSFVYAVIPVPQGGDPTKIAQVLVEDPPSSGATKPYKESSGVPRLWRGGRGEESTWFSLHFHSAIHLANNERGNVILAGPPNVLDYLETTAAVERPAMAAALEAAGDGPLQIAVAPPQIFDRASREILGPVKIDSFSLGIALADGFQWAALGVHAEDGITANVIIQSANLEAAKQMKQLIDSGLATAVNASNAQENRLNENVKLIDLRVAGSQLHWRLDKQHTPPQKFIASLQPFLMAQQLRLGLSKSRDNMKQIVLSFHNTHDVYRAFPTPANYDSQGKPLLSWRVHVLPFLEEGELYRQFRRDEPWDSPHNTKLIERMPAVYRRPFADAKTTKTPYLMPIGDKTAFQPGKKTTGRDIRDGTVKTIGIVEVDPDHEVIWTKPDDWEVDWAEPTKGLTGGPGKSFLAALLDGSVRTFAKSIDKDILRALLTGNGGESIDASKLPY